MKGGRAAAINHANRQKKNKDRPKSGIKQTELISKYGLEEVPKVDRLGAMENIDSEQLKRYKNLTAPVRESLDRPSTATSKTATGGYDHYADIEKARQLMEEDDQEIKRDRDGDLMHEFDSIAMNKPSVYNKSQGELRLKHNYLSKED